MLNTALLDEMLKIKNNTELTKEQIEEKALEKASQIVGKKIELSKPKPEKKTVVKPKTTTTKTTPKEAEPVAPSLLEHMTNALEKKTTTKAKKANPFESCVKKLIKLINKFKKDNPERKIFHYVTELDGTPLWSDTRLIIHLNKSSELLDDYKLPESVGKYPAKIKEIFDGVAETKLATIVSKDFKEAIKDYKEEYIVIGKYVFSLSYLKTIANLTSNFEIYGDPDKTLLPVKIKSEFFTGILAPVRASGESVDKLMKYGN